MIELPINYPEFPKISRWSREIVITEKIDGTNAQILILEDDRIFSGSRTRWITAEDDNYGFASWVKENRQSLLMLGAGQHFGEWWGSGIQRNYSQPKKRFSLFNVGRWNKENVPNCCDIVPILYKGPLTHEGVIQGTINKLQKEGSLASPGFMNPEGIVIYHAASKTMFKKTIEKDEEYKGKNAPKNGQQSNGDS